MSAHQAPPDPCGCPARSARRRRGSSASRRRGRARRRSAVLVEVTRVAAVEDAVAGPGTTRSTRASGRARARGPRSGGRPRRSPTTSPTSIGLAQSSSRMRRGRDAPSLQMRSDAERNEKRDAAPVEARGPSPCRDGRSGRARRARRPAPAAPRARSAARRTGADRAPSTARRCRSRRDRSGSAARRARSGRGVADPGQPQSRGGRPSEVVPPCAVSTGIGRRGRPTSSPKNCSLSVARCPRSGACGWRRIAEAAVPRSEANAGSVPGARRRTRRRRTRASRSSGRSRAPPCPRPRPRHARRPARRGAYPRSHSEPFGPRTDSTRRRGPDRPSPAGGKRRGPVPDSTGVVLQRVQERRQPRLLIVRKPRHNDSSAFFRLAVVRQDRRVERRRPAVVEIRRDACAVPRAAPCA